MAIPRTRKVVERRDPCADPKIRCASSVDGSRVDVTRAERSCARVATRCGRHGCLSTTARRASHPVREGLLERDPDESASPTGRPTRFVIPEGGFLRDGGHAVPLTLGVLVSRTPPASLNEPRLRDIGTPFRSRWRWWWFHRSGRAGEGRSASRYHRARRPSCVRRSSRTR